MREELNKSYYQNDLVKSKRMFEEASKKLSFLKKEKRFYNEENSKLEDLPLNLLEVLIIFKVRLIIFQVK